MTLQLRIASPCTERWDDMAAVDGDRQRHCAKCKLNVFNIKELEDTEVRALLAKASGGRVCVRLYRRADGTVLTRDCPTGLARVRRKALMAVVMLVSMLMAGTSYALGRAPACATSTAPQSWFDRLVTTRVVSAREELRGTKTFGPLVEKLWPSPVMMEMGDIGP
jgi:hypothetical protein